MTKLGTTLATAFLFLLPPFNPVHPDIIWLDIPALHVRVAANDAAVIQSAAFDAFQVTIKREPSDVNYGSIYVKINTEAANIIMTTGSTADGIVCKFDLARRGSSWFQPGRNSIEISFSDQRQRLHYASFLLDVAVSAPTPKLVPSGPPERLSGQKYAVVVGVSKYSNRGAGLENLKFADRDAAAFRDFLLSPAGGSFPMKNLRYLVNEDATVQNVRSALFTFLTSARPDDFVVVYFAGHGAPDPNDRRNLYLLMYDTKPEDMGGTAFPMWQLQDVFTRILKTRRVVTFADSCHSYGISGERLGGGAKSNNLINQYMSKLAGEGDRAVITASDISQLSFESEQWDGGHGVFTYYLLKGLRGEADTNHDGTVTAGELFAYVKSHVEESTGGEQVPVALPGMAAHLPLSGAAVRPSNTTAATRTLGENDVARADELKSKP